jgi:hypothetical protein
MPGTVRYTFPVDSPAAVALEIVSDQIKAADLAETGNPVGSYVLTVRDGLLGMEGPVHDFLAAQKAFSVMLTFSHCITVDATSSQVFITVRAPILQRLYNFLGNIGSFTQANGQYVPCVPIAYVVPKTASKYELALKGATGILHQIDSLELLHSDGTTSETITLL